MNIKNKILSNFIYRYLAVVLVSSFSVLEVNAQCGFLPTCPSTDYTNFGIGSNSTAATIEYDNFVSSFHSSVVRTANGEYKVWGAGVANNGTGNLLSPTIIDATNFPAISGSILKAGLASLSTTEQGLVLTTNGLFAWGDEGIMINAAITTSPVFQAITVNGETDGLPVGVNPLDIKMMFTTRGTVAIVTCSGDVYVLTLNAANAGIGGAASSTQWHHVTEVTAGNPFISNVVAIRGQFNTLFALKSDGTLWTWGSETFLGNTTPSASRDRATQVTLPTSANPIKMIGVTRRDGVNASSYFVLNTDGNMYSLGENGDRQLGDWTVTDRLVWVQPRYSSAVGPVMDNIHWISAQEHDHQYASINVITDDSTNYNWGTNSLAMLGRLGVTVDPGIPGGITVADKILAVETGGHTSMLAKKCEDNFGYVGHRINGSMGDGSATTATETAYTFATAIVYICGAFTANVAVSGTPTLSPGGLYCNGTSTDLLPSPAGGTLSIVSGPATLAGTVITFTGTGNTTVVVQYSISVPGCPISVTATTTLLTENCNADLSVVKTVDNSTPNVGANVTFTITVNNAGSSNAPSVVVNDVLPAGYAFVSATPSQGTWTAPNWNAGTINNGSSANIVIVATVLATGSYANTATVTSALPDPILANNTSTVTPCPSRTATITYAGSPFCSSIVGAQAVTRTGTAGGTYTSAPVGLTINAATGAVTPSTSTAGTYTVTYTIAASGGCPVFTTTTSVTITTAPAATISYSGTPYCTSVVGAQAVTLTGTSGGAYSSTAGLTINAVTGAITPSSSAGGTYTVTYTVAASGGCALFTTTTSVTITTAPAATISYSGTPFCSSISTAQSASLTGTSGGTYTSTAGLTINAATGAITPSTSTAGTYTVTYTIAASGGCALFTTTTSVTITTGPAATISYSGTPYCTSVVGAQAVTLTGTTGGAYSSTAGLTINAVTGAITPSTSTAGTYTVTYTIAAAGGCALFTTTTSVTITTAPAATISYSGSPYCTSVIGAQAVTLTGTTGGAYSSTAGLTINAVTGAITPSSSAAGTYTVTYTIAAAGGCALFTTTSSVTITTGPSAIISYSGTPYCTSVVGAQAVTLTGTSGGTYTSTAGLTINAVTGAITPSTSTAGTYTVTYTIAASGGCALFTTTTSVTITTAPAATISYSGSPYCTSVVGAQAVTLTGTSGGAYSSTAGLTINAVTGAITPSSSAAGTYTVTYTIAAAGGCALFTTTSSVTITTGPSATISYSGTPYCTSVVSAQAVTLTGTSGGAYSSTAGLTINAVTGAITPSSSAAGTYTVTYTVAASGGCSLFTTTTSVTITTAPAATISYSGTPFCSSISTAQSASLTGTSGGTYTSTAGLTINAATGAITPSTSTAGTYTVTYTIAASGGCALFTTTTSVTITTGPAATISYSGTPYCTSVVGAQAVTLTGTTGGAFSSTAGLTINAVTGAITPSTSTAGTYTVTYTVAASGGCALFTTTSSVTITTAPAATISYSGTPYCTSVVGAQAVTLTGTSGGAYSSTAGLTINAVTGAITPSSSAAGTYTVTYTVAASGGCALFTTTTSLTIATAPAATISYAGSPFCSNVIGAQAVTQTGTPGGTYTSAPVGLTINSTTGAVTPSTSTAGTYTVTYTIAASGGCASITTTASVTISAPPSVPTVGSNTPVCIGQIINLTATSAGASSYSWTGPNSFSSTLQNPSIINATLLMAGTYSVTASIGTCASSIGTTTVVINATPSAPTASSNSPVCLTYPINLGASTILSAAYNWTGPSAFVSTSQNPFIASATLPMTGTYTVTATVSGCLSLPATVAVIAQDCSPSANFDAVSVDEDSIAVISVLANDTDPQNNIDTSSVTITDAPNNGTATVGVGGVIIYTPNPNFNGTDTLIYQICDTTIPIPFCDTAIIFITVTPVNDPPVINDTTITTPEDSVITVCLPITDGETGQTYSVSSCGGPLNGTTTTTVIGNQVCVTYTPNPNYNGLDSFCIVVCDNGIPSLCDTAIIVINITPVNDAPIVNDTAITTPEDSPITVCLPILDVDAGQTYAVTSCGAPVNGTATTTVIGNQVCVTYTPNPNYSGLDSLCIVVCDNGIPSLCDTAVINIIVTPVNDPPVINDTIITIPEDSVITVCLPILDVDAGQTYAVTSCGAPLNGTATSTVIGNQVCVTYTPNPNYNGLDSLCIIVCDNGIPALCDTAIIVINITPVNDAPIVNDTTITTPEDSPITVCLPILDVDAGQTYAVTSCGAPLNGTATSTVIGNQVCITYTPNPNYNGLDSLCIVVCDNGIPSLCDTAVIVIDVTPVNDAPIVNDSTITTPEDSPITVCLPILDVDAGQTYAVTSCGAPLNGTATSTVTGNQVCVTYTPNPNYSGLDSLCIVVCDNGIPSLCDTAVIVIDVTPVNDAPIVNDTTITTPEDSPITVCLPILDVDAGQTYSVSSCGGPLNGTTTTTVIGNQVCITYTPNPNYNGLDSLCIVVCDNGSPSLCDTAVINIIVTPVNDPPVVNDTLVVTPLDSVVTVCLPISDPDVGQTYSVSSCSGPLNGTATTTVLGNEVCITYTPNTGYIGLDSLCIIICDNGSPSLCDTAVIVIDVTPVNDAPIVNDTTITTPEDSPITVCLPILDVDAGQTYAATSCGAPLNGTATSTVIGNQVCVTYTPNPNYNGLDSLCIVVCDNGIPSLCDTAVIVIDVTPVNDAPIVNDSTISTPEDSTITVCLPILDVDAGQSYTVSSCGSPLNGTATSTVTGNQVCITYTPNPNYNGLDSLCIVVCDNGIPSLCDTAVIVIDVTPVNDAPIVNDTTITTPEDSPITVCLPILDVDAGQTYSVSSCGGPLNGTTTTTVIGNQVCITYTPNPNFNGADSLCIVVCDNGIPSLCDTAVINIIVTPVNNPPLVNDTLVLTPLDSVVTVCLPISDLDVGQTYSVSSCGGPLNGTATTTVIANQVCITYTPTTGYIGLDSLCIIICDNGSPSLCDTAVIVIDVQSCTLSNPLADCDGDGVTNGTEIIDGTDPSNPCDYVFVNQTLTPSLAWNTLDCDGDGVTNITEVADSTDPTNPCDYLTASITLSQTTNWLNADCDGDGVINGTEITDGTDPNNPCNFVLASQTVTPNAAWYLLDCDGDGIPNGDELDGGSNPLDPCSPVVCDFFVPEGFSPNGDGTNDLLVIRGIENYLNNTFTVYNRWGNKVFEGKPYNNTWDGKSNEGIRIGGDELPTGTYFYVLDLGDDSDIIKGFIYLTR